jgi:hypothetical protein
MITYKKYELVAPDGFGHYSNVYEGIEWDNLELALQKFGMIKCQLLAGRKFICLQLREVEYEVFNDGDDVVIEDRLIAEIDTSRLPRGGYMVEIN